MSTKIYNGYRMSPRVFEKNFLPAFREFAFTKAIKITGEVMACVEEQYILDKARQVYDSNDWTHEINFDDFLNERKLVWRLQKALELLAAVSSSAYRTYACIDASVNVWLFNGKFYVIPYSEHVGDFEVPSNVEEYGYWNNCDQPEHVTWRQWQARGAMWERVCLKNEEWNLRRMTHVVIDAAEHTGLIEIAEHFLKGCCWNAYAALPVKQRKVEEKEELLLSEL